MSLRRYGQAVHRRRRRILLAAVAALVVAGVVGAPILGELDANGDFDDPSSESVKAAHQVAALTGAEASPSVVALVRLPAPAGSPRGQAKIAAVAARLRDPRVASIVRYTPGSDRRLVSRDGRSTYLVASYRADAGDPTSALEDRLAGVPGVALGGHAVAFDHVGGAVSGDIARAEALAFPILFLVSLAAFRSALAALLPLAVGAATILCSFLVMRGVNALTPMSVYSLNLINGLGLGLAIDYSLFMVSRFREELAAGRPGPDALGATVATAGRTVLFSAVTVAAALAALLVFRLRFLYSMGVGGSVCALMAALVALTVLAALLAALGPRVNAGSLPRWRRLIARDAGAERTGFWYRHSQRVMRRPVGVATGAAVLLLALGLPFTGIRFTGVDASALPREDSARVVYEALRTQFPPNEGSPVYVAAKAPPTARAQVRAYAARLARLANVAGPPRVRCARSGCRIDVLAPAPALGAAAKQVVHDVRAVPAPFPVAVGGETAAFLDQQSSLASRLPAGLAILVATTLAILFLMTGSLVLPVKALVMNLLSLSAAFGLLVLVFQDGRLEGLLGFRSQGALESSQPVLLFAVAFGLSTDYGVFLLGRIKELHDRGLPNEDAVALGLQRTGRIVTFAALLFMIAIGAFLTSRIVFIKELGFGTAAAVLIDATIVRALLVPALMRLLGERNWWAPRPLARLHRRVGLGEATA
jgi:RND superfamily putative drug exporter